ncbi:hypothetical protein K8R03_03375, partial [Candidatus Kaiserbacteria bacterium]|nr:hypothetical protein [Candidatus Kaiserbacteria bacterium]
MKFFKTILYGVTGLLAPLLLPSMASAHAFGQQYTLPLPISLYATGASIALIASFVILSFFSRPHAGAGRALERVYALPPWAPSRWTHVAARTFGLAVLAFAVAAGFFGSDVPVKNPALFLFWIGLLLVVAYVSAFLSGVWERIDPFRTLVELVLGRSYPPLLSRFPSWLKYVPPLLFFYFV